MLYPDLQYLRSCYSEVEYWKKAANNAGTADALTNAGLRKKEKLELINSRLTQANAEYSAAKQKILQNKNFHSMNECLKNACIEYYFNGKSLAFAENTYYSSSFLRDVRNYCHKI